MLKKIINKYKCMNNTAKAGMWFIICNFFQKGISFVTVPIFTRIMTPSEYGVTTVFNTWSGILVIFATLNVSASVYNRGLVKYNQKKFTSIVQTVSTFFSIIVLSLIIAFKNFFTKITGIEFPLLILMSVYFIFEIGLSLWSVKERFNYRYKKLVIVTLLNTIFSIGISILAVVLSKNKSDAKIISSTVALIIIALPFYIKNFVDGKKFFDKEIWKYILSFSLPLIPHYLSNIILNQSDKIMINYFCGASSVAMYGVAYSIANIVKLLTDAITNTLTPWRYKNLENKNYQKINFFSIKLLIVIAILICLINLFAPEVLLIIAGSKYKEAIWVIPPVILSVYFIFLYGFFSSVEFYFLETKFMMVASVLSAALNIFLNYIFIGVFGYIVCAYTTLICYIIYTICHYTYMKFICKKHINSKAIYDIRRILLITLICIIITLLSSLLYFNVIIRYVIILIFFAIIIKFKEKILKVFEEVNNNG